METPPHDTRIEIGAIEGKEADKPKLFTPLEVWELLDRRVGRDALYGKLHSGELGSIRVGRHFVIPKGALEKFLEGHQ